jgi:hypothetical protein
MLTACLTVSSLANAVQPVFTEVSAQSGIQLQAESNSMSGGIAWIDFNNDGNQDLFIPNEGGPNRLYRNEGNGQFTEIAAQAGVQNSPGASQGATVGDYDGDGNDDLFIASSGINTLYRNMGDGTFTDVTAAAALNDVGKRSFAASFGDVNGDGWLDLYVGHWDFQSQPTLHCPDNDLYLNNGDGTFTNVSVVSGSNNPGCAFTVPMTDFDQDGDLDLFLPNDNVAWGSQTASLDNEMLRNEGYDPSGIPMFVAVGDEIGLGESLTGMGVAIGDYDNDGDLDYYRTQIGAGPLSTNDGTNNFTASVLSNDGGTGWGAAFFDADNDGFIDLYRGNSGSGFDGNGQPNRYYHNNGDGTFTRMEYAVGLTSINAGLGLAYADYDNDGDVDVVVHGQYGDINLFRNDTPATNNWIRVELQGNAPNHRGIGSIVRLSSSNSVGTRQQLRELHAGSSHGSTHASPVLFGLGDNDNFGFSSTTTTDANGFYSQEVTDGTYVVYGLVNNNYTVSCGYIFVGVSGADVTKDCVATPILRTISGTVTTPDGQPVAGIQIQINDNFGFSSTTTTDANGFYSQEVTDGTYVVYGLNDNFGFSSTTTTDANGFYSQEVTDGTYVVYGLVNNNYTISCGYIFVGVSGADVTKDCVATPN